MGLGLDLSNRVHQCEVTKDCASTRPPDNIHPQIGYFSNKQGSLRAKGEFTWTVVEHIWSGGKICPKTRYSAATALSIRVGHKYLSGKG